MKIYTKTGDDGLTGLYGGQRISKTSARIGAIGDVDELNAVIGVARLNATGEIDEELRKIQNWLFDLGGELASTDGANVTHRPDFQKPIEFLEQSIDRQTAELEPLKNFILPGGVPLAAHLHLARAVCRRAERSVLEQNELNAVREETRIFLNRLSDWLFTAARTANRLANVEDIAWSRTKD